MVSLKYNGIFISLLLYKRLDENLKVESRKFLFPKGAGYHNGKNIRWYIMVKHKSIRLDKSSDYILISMTRRGISFHFQRRELRTGSNEVTILFFFL